MLDFHGLLKWGDVSLLVGVQQRGGGQRQMKRLHCLLRRLWTNRMRSLGTQPVLMMMMMAPLIGLQLTQLLPAPLCFHSYHCSQLLFFLIDQYRKYSTVYALTQGDGFSFVVLVKSWAIHTIRTLLNLFSPGCNNILVSLTVEISFFFLFNDAWIAYVQHIYLEIHNTRVGLAKLLCTSHNLITINQFNAITHPEARIIWLHNHGIQCSFFTNKTLVGLAWATACSFEVGKWSCSSEGWAHLLLRLMDSFPRSLSSSLCWCPGLREQIAGTSETGGDSLTGSWDTRWRRVGGGGGRGRCVVCIFRPEDDCFFVFFCTHYM